jgi:hypothetical protein
MVAVSVGAFILFFCRRDNKKGGERFQNSKPCLGDYYFLRAVFQKSDFSKKSCTDKSAVAAPNTNGSQPFSQKNNRAQLFFLRQPCLPPFTYRCYVICRRPRALTTGSATFFSTDRRTQMIVSNYHTLIQTRGRERKHTFCD